MVDPALGNFNRWFAGKKDAGEEYSGKSGATEKRMDSGCRGVEKGSIVLRISERSVCSRQTEILLSFSDSVRTVSDSNFI